MDLPSEGAAGGDAALDPDRRVLLRRRYWSLGCGELVSSVVFVVVGVLAVPSLAAPAVTLWAVLLPLCGILLIAGGYWLVARRHLGRGLPPGVAAVYDALRRLLPVVLAASAVIAISMPPRTPVAGLVVAGVWVFAILEYLNYFVVRLAYPWHRWAREVTRWRSPQLVRDVRSVRGRRGDS